TDTNDAVTGLTLETQTVAENARGAVVGQLTVADQDVADTHSYTVSDDRFEVVDGALKLKDGIALDHEAAAQVDVEVTVTDAAGSAHTESFAISVTDQADLSVSTGFQAKYFDVDQRLRAISDVDWDATPTHQELVSNINYTNSAGSFWEGGARDTFGAEISGTIEVETGGVYRFDLSADDGAQLFVNGQQVVDNDGLHGYRLRSGELELPPGSHHIEVRYFENYGHAGLKLEWDGPDTNGTEPVIAPDVSDAQTVSGMPIALSVSHPDTASGEPTDLILEGLPVGTLVEAAGQTFVTGSAGRVDITGFDGDLITVNPPTDFSGQLDAVVTMINSSDPSGGVEISQSIGIDVNPANVVAPSAQLVTGFSVDYIDMDQRIRNLNDVDWDAEPSYQDHRSEIDFQNSANSFWEGGSRDTFGVRIEGQITVEGGGSYEFFTSADDGVALYVNGERVINDDGNHGYRTRSGQIDLEPGTHNIEMRYFENYGHAGLKLEWQGPDTEGRETLQADQGTAIDVNGTLDVGIDLTGASPPASLSMTGLPANTILMSGDDALLTDGGPADLSGWNINALEISPPAGYEGTISGDIILSDTAFNGAQTTSINSYEIVVGNLVAAEYSDPGAGDPSPFGAETSPQSLAWDAVPEGRDEETDETSANNKDVLSEPVVVQVNGEVTQIGTDTYERVDW
ncbi:hypothetical protein J7400_20940, partial [Shimia sp. R9_2]|uniref:PA14 domain-containing protein n=1 Tax=Shimia sp. R9_2 TaxID=2821112 RepID=UPI001ADB3C60